jgi:hypothetical protein
MAMFAAVSTVELPEGGTIEEGRKQLETEVIPMIKQAPGFVSAIFLSPPTGREGLSIVVFETQQQAQMAVDNMQTPPTVRVLTKEVREVAAKA